MNTTTKRFPRSQMDVWPWHGVLTHYRRPLAERVGKLIGSAAVLSVFALLGVLLAYRG